MNNPDIFYNKSIHGPKGAYLILQNVDLERLRDLNLTTAVVFYTSKNSIGGSKAARYDGPILTDYHPDMVRDLGNVALPQPKYDRFVPNDFEKKASENNFVPSYTLFDHPNDLEFLVTASNPAEYNGLFAFRDIIVPALFHNGYDKYNASHTSQFWLHVGKEIPPIKNKHVLSINPHQGLSIYKKDADQLVSVSYPRNKMEWVVELAYA